MPELLEKVYIFMKRLLDVTSGSYTHSPGSEALKPVVIDGQVRI
jgi:hypothetical protein